MVRETFLRRIENIRNEVMQLGEHVEQSLSRAVASLQNQNAAVALWVIENDERIDEARRVLEDRVIQMFATQQPVVAQDLRLLATIASIATELERMGDYASHIAHQVYQDPDQMAQIEWSEDIDRMTALTQEMLHDSLHAFVEQDVEKAYRLGQTDKQVDMLRTRLRDQLIGQAQQDGQYIGATVDMLEVVNLLERTADRTTNIGEYVIYIVTSKREELNP